MARIKKIYTDLL